MAESPPSGRNGAPSRRADLLPNEQEISYEHIHDFFNRNKTWITVVCVMLVLLAVWMVFARFQEDRAREEAGKELADAMAALGSGPSGLEQLERVARDYAKTDAGLQANLLLADICFQQRQYDRARECYYQVQLHHPLSPLAPSAALGVATIEEVAGQAPEALRIYQAVVADYPKSFQAPQAAFGAARLLEGSGKLGEARKEYENLVTRYPDSAWKDEAKGRLERVNQQIKFTPPAGKGAADGEAPK